MVSQQSLGKLRLLNNLASRGFLDKDMVFYVDRLIPLGDLLSCLTDRQKYVVSLLYGLGNSPLLSANSLANSLTVTKTRILQIESKALRDLGISINAHLKDVERKDSEFFVSPTTFEAISPSITTGVSMPILRTITIDSLGLRERACNILKSHKLTTAYELIYNLPTLPSLRNIGEETTRNVIGVLASLVGGVSGITDIYITVRNPQTKLELGQYLSDVWWEDNAKRRYGVW